MTYLCFVDSSGLFKNAFSEEGYCSAPSGLSTEAKAKPLYWKVDNPTLSPVHLKGQSYVFVMLFFFPCLTKKDIIMFM